MAGWRAASVDWRLIRSSPPPDSITFGAILARA
jgi:hypothetical protein